MKKILRNTLVVLSVFLVLGITACDDEGSITGRDDVCINCTPTSFCSPDDVRETFTNSDCFAEEMVIGCPNLSCRSSETGVMINNLRGCQFIDCQTLSCDEFRFIADSQLQQASGFITEITLDNDGFPIGFFEVLESETSFDCAIVVP